MVGDTAAPASASMVEDAAASGLGETLPDFLAWNSRFQSWLSATDGTLDDEVYGSDCPAVNSVTSVAGVSGAASVGVFGVAAAHVFVVSWIVYATGDTD